MTMLQTREKHDRTTTTIDHLTPEQIEELGRELDAIRAEVMDDLGSEDAAYIRKMIKIQRTLELSSRAVLLFSLFPPAWVIGTAGLSLAKILDNMEIGHNVLHGQWDWMRDPKIHSTSWEWDHASPAKQWQRSHNEGHHTWTNVLGKDDDLGYGIMRVDREQPWLLKHLAQPITATLNALFFEWGIASYDMQTLDYVEGRITREQLRENARQMFAKLRRQLARDYVVHPLLSGPGFLHTFAANVVANVVRNVWSNAVIICGHFPEGVQVFPEDSVENETRGHWYARQLLGSANISGGRLFHIMTGNLSHQIEHHLYPDMPSNRLAQVAPKVRAVMEKNGLTYVTGPMHKQLASVWGKIFTLSVPNEQPGRSRIGIIAGEVRRKLGERTRGPGVTAGYGSVQPA